MKLKICNNSKSEEFLKNINFVLQSQKESLVKTRSVKPIRFGDFFEREIYIQIYIQKWKFLPKVKVLSLVSYGAEKSVFIFRD